MLIDVFYDGFIFKYVWIEVIFEDGCVGVIEVIVEIWDM